MAALPGFGVNVLSGNDYLISINYHYNFQTLAILFAASAIGFGWLKQKTGQYAVVNYLVLAGLLSSSVWANNQWGHLPFKKTIGHIKGQYSTFKNSRIEARFQRLAAHLPDDSDVPISVTHDLLPRFAHRNEVYMFPNPYKAHYWGINGENLPSPGVIEALMLNTSRIDGEGQEIVKRLLETGEFWVEKDGSWLVARRAKPGDSQNVIADPL